MTPPLILTPRRHRVFQRLDHDIRRTVTVGFGLPVQRGRGRAEWRHVGRITFGGAVIDPLDDGRDLGVGERHVVLELLDADALVDVPRWHLTLDYTSADRFRPGASLGEGPE